MNRTIERVSHPLKMRMLQVKSVTKISANMAKITLTGDDLEGFISASPDDHVKVFFPYPGDLKPIVPVITAEGPQAPEGERKPIMRDYTPTRFDSALKELDINFVLHGQGPGSNWAINAKEGDYVGVAGPRGSLIIPYNFDWYFLIGDESAIPSFSRRLKELPQNAKAIVLIELEDENSKQDFKHSENVSLKWVNKNKGESLLTEVKKVQFLSGDPFVWVAAEKSSVSPIKEYLLQEKTLNPDWVKSAAYWTK